LDGVAVSGATGASWAYTPSSAGSHTVYVKVTDSATSPVTAASGAGGVTVNAALSVTISPASVTLDVGQSQLLTANPVGGTLPLAYQWYLGGVPVQGATSAVWTFVPESAGTYAIYVVVTDGASVAQNNQSSTLQVTVNSAPSVAISPSSVTLDVGQSQTFTASVSGGTASFSYQWYLNNSAVSGATSSSWTFAPSFAGSYTVYLDVTDSVGVVAISNSVLITVNMAPSATISPSPVTLDVGQSQTFTAVFSGGTPSYSCQWYLNGVAISGATSSSWTFTPTSTGMYSVYSEVIDSATPTANIVKSNNVAITVNSALSVTISPKSAALDVGQSQTFTSKVTGGTPSYSYQWYLNGLLVLGANGTTWTCSPSVVGSYRVYLEVMDSTKASNMSNVVTVNVYPKFSTSISPVSVVQGVFQSQLFTSSISGGTSSYSYQWYVNGTAQPSATSTTWTFPPSPAGNYTVYVVVTDGTGAQAKSNVANVTVYLHYVAITNFTVSKTAIGQGFSDDINITMINQGSYTETFGVAVYANATSIASQSAIILLIDQSITWPLVWNTTGFNMGNYIITAQIALALGETNTASNTYTYGIVKVGALSVGISPSSIVLDVGQSKLLVTTILKGTPPYSYQWYLNGSAVSGATSQAWNFNASRAGHCTVYVEVMDSLGLLAKSNTATIIVYGTLSVSVSPVSVALGVFESQSFTASAFGGTSPYSYQWYVNGTAQPGATSVTWTFSNSSAGYYMVYVVVTDGAEAQKASDVANVTVYLYPWPTEGVVGITGYKLVFAETFNNFFSSNATIDYYWSFSIDEWNGTQWVAAAIGGSSTTVVGYVILGSTTVNLPYVYLLNQSSVKWGEWLKVSYTFNWTYNGTNYSTDYTAKLNVHPGDIAGAAVVFPYLGADGVCNLLDVTPIALNWLKKVPTGTDPTSPLAIADINGDGVVNILDVMAIALHWLQRWTNTPPPG
jgi:hypothetical protein